MEQQNLLQIKYDDEIKVCRTRKKFPCLLVHIRNVLVVLILLLLIVVYRGIKIRDAEFEAMVPKNGWFYLMFKEKEQPALNLSVIRRLIDEYNRNETILNQDIYGPIKKDTTILVIQVKTLTLYLKNLIMSMSDVHGIEDALVVFSHSHYDENLNEFVRSIDFCRILQIYFPYSLQANPDTFPGFEAGDCPYYIDIATARAQNCTGAYNPDLHGYYRHPSTVEKKHHWWWTANKVFENLTFSSKHEGMVVFLDDDLFLLQDFLYMVVYMKESATPLSQYEFLSLGTLTGDIVFDESKAYRVAVTSWDPQYHTAAMAFDVTTWNKIVSHFDLFCNVDEFSWSRSLFYLSLNKKGNGDRFKVLSCDTPRAYKIKPQTLYERMLQLTSLDTVYRLLQIKTKYEDNLFPPTLEVYTDIELRSQEFNALFTFENSGGWGDLRDKLLCQNMTIAKIKQVVFDMERYIQEQNFLD
ncbi:alpha-1,6-mannosyl-glycoprotein 2-beta-N-acetylglucosaminyltransferase-like [Pectinophora gossypiella]|uniref:alpha-1,6-mannosyl-glycoprotein 2-beta-N-acetylglucosaminyltransferase-like n=1 Tax=Pectinophora gossypiella TaxID=13191 RepID=UPI00214F2D31|nr:alpha-1,6-mannosyl-glycoprotein 2-beta-N-acetylglucosaminyltransferase-like [Pectinophora gossypiella]